LPPAYYLGSAQGVFDDGLGFGVNLAYLDKLAAAGETRDPDVQVIQFDP